MQYHHSSFLSVMCKCSYIVTTEGDSRHRPTFAAAPTVPNHRKPGSEGFLSTGNLNTARVTHPSSRRGGKPGATTAGGLNSPTTRNAVAAGRGSGPSPRISLVKRSKLKRRVTISSGSNQSTGNGSGDKFADETDWPPFADEDYIVFCFEEDGAFHVVMEESPKPVSQIKKKQNQCDQEEGETPDQYAACACSLDKKAAYHFQPPHSRRDCLLANKEVDEERFLFSPRFDFHEGRDRIVDDIPELDFDEIKSRDPSRDDDDGDGFQGLDFDETRSLDQFEAEEVERRNSSMECCNGSVESSSSSQSNWSPESQGIDSEEDDDRDNEEEGREEDQVEEFETELSESCEPSQCDMGDEKLEDEAEGSPTRSRGSSRSNSSASSFTFPVSQWEWIDSPEIWPRTRSLHLTKIKPRPVCLRCCGRF